jgi:excisionase family DNA binding protein
MEDSMQENLLTIEQVAQYLKIDKFTVYRLVTQKKSQLLKWETNGDLRGGCLKTG